MFESFAAAVRAWAALRVCRSAIFLSVAAFALLACGRSSLDDSLVTDGGTFDVIPPIDARPDAGSCGPSTCPTGCCDASGVCRNGTDLLSCGSFGGKCADCPSKGFDFCDVTSRACGRTLPGGCDATSCADGCCQNNQCFGGTDPDACGINGDTCQPCASHGQACDPGARTCGGTRCGKENCSGCCVGDLCVGGADQTSCGQFGQQCRNCQAQGTSCQPTSPGGICEGQPSCGPQNCKGCCDGNTCSFGQDDTACGGSGNACTNCRQFNEYCDGMVFPPQCGPQLCGPQNCNGCCQGNFCVGGTDNLACGASGQQCSKCGSSQQCTNGQCQGTSLCDPGNCSGCCVGDICATGSQNTACGTSGKTCLNCAANGQSCQGGACITICGPGNCPGCCNGNQCVMGGTTQQCGAGGAACKACSAGDLCSAGTCKTPVTCGTCAAGCCDPVQGCLAGFLPTSCGSGGTACANCTLTGSTCDIAVSPRTCRDQQMTCPASYPSCPAGVTSPVLPIQHVCSASDLQNARFACAGAGAPQTNGCLSFFAFEQMNNPACATCLAPFDVALPAQDFSGVFTCAAPFVSAACDHATACATDCLATSCDQCPAGAGTMCRNNAVQSQCGTYFQQALGTPTQPCLNQATTGPAAFCNPQNYGNNYGRWLQGVGGHYCGP